MKHKINTRKRGCPTCNGVDPKTCCRCQGKTILAYWINTDMGWDYQPPRPPDYSGTY